ncbi:MAG: tryptophan 2,3-dioxygenase [Blastocatellia bacterium]|nr:tryptophan 2,3-dioxygenase [Blastocatellia bacterium]
MDQKLSYNEYLKVSDLLRAQQLQSTPTHHDEMLFIIIHQTYELWFRLIIHELDAAIAAVFDGNIFYAEQLLARVTEIQHTLVNQIHILETMQPINFLAFRDKLRPASGFQSWQFREIEIMTGVKEPKVLTVFNEEVEIKKRLEERLAAPSLGDAFYTLLAKSGFKVEVAPSRDDREEWSKWKDKVVPELLKLYTETAKYADLYRLAERLIDIDEYAALWRYHHLRIVERIIGVKQGTGGSEGLGYLQTTLSRKAFPELWEVRTRLEFRQS